MDQSTTAEGVRSENSRPILHVISGDLWGGSEAQMAMQLAAMRELGLDVRALFLNDGEVSKRFAERGIPCVYAEERRGVFACFSIFRRQIRTLRPSILVSHGFKENILSSLCSVLYGLPWIPVFHGFREKFQGLNAKKAWLYYQASEFLARVRACRIITVSKALARDLKVERDGRLRVVRNVVRLGQGSPEPSRLTEFVPPGVKSFIFVGRLVKVKRGDLLIESFADLKNSDAHLLMVGEGPEETAWKALAEQCGVGSRVHFLGFRENAMSYLAEAECFVLCSDYEGIPTVLLEAMELGRKVVVTEVGGIPEVLEMFPGYPCERVPAGNRAALSQAMEKMIQSSATPSSENRQAVKEQFSPDVAARAHEAIYREVLRVQ